MNILIIQTTNPRAKPIMTVTDAHVAQIKAIVPDATITSINDTDTIADHIATADVVIAPDINALPLEKATNLKWIQVTSAGVNGLSKELTDNDMIITNASGVHPIPIAEHVMTFLLMFARQLHKLHTTQVQKKTWDYSYEKYPAFELHGKTVLITGLGRIGSQIAHLAKGLDMKVLAMVRDLNKKNPEIDELFTKESLADMLPRADFVINAMPLTNETKYFFNKDTFKRMKPSAHFINIGRGPVTNEKDLIKALNNKTIAGAGLDVMEVEPLPDESPLWGMENVILTPHSSGQTPEYMNRVITIFCENLKGYINKANMPNLVDKKKGY